MFSNAKPKRQAEAYIADGCLVLSCPHATEPVVWRMEVEKIGTASFEVKSNDKEGTAKLVLKPKKGTAELIANFDTQNEALDALVITSDALQSQSTGKKTRHKKAKAPEQSVDNNVSDTSSNKWVVIALSVALVVVLYIYMSSLIPEVSNVSGQQQNNNVSAPLSPQEATGVPVSADDFLQGF